MLHSFATKLLFPNIQIEQNHTVYSSNLKQQTFPPVMGSSFCS